MKRRQKMALEVSTSKRQDSLESIDLKFLRELLQTHPQYNQHKWDTKSAADFLKKPKNPAAQRQTERRRCFEKLIGRLVQRDIPGKELVEEYLRNQYRRNYRVNTMRNALFVIDSFLTFVKGLSKTDLNTVTHKDVLAYIEHEQDRGMSADTVKVRVGLLRTFLRYLMERDLIAPEVMAQRIIIKVPDSLPRAMDPADEKKLLDVQGSVRDRTMILLLLRTGMRIGELLNTLVEEVYLKERRIEIYEAEKTRVGRVVYLSDDARLSLKAWFEIRDGRKDYLFYTHRERMSYAAARNLFIRYLEKAGISHRGYTLHSLRHTFASELLNAGMRLECVQPLLGHSSIEMTRRYARLTDKTREEEYFKAMEIIERGEIDGHYRMDNQLQEIFKAEKLLSAHDQKLYEHAETLYPLGAGSGSGGESQNN
jgi:integrase/recombinase XerD